MELQISAPLDTVVADEVVEVLGAPGAPITVNLTVVVVKEAIYPLEQNVTLEIIHDFVPVGLDTVRRESAYVDNLPKARKLVGMLGHEPGVVGVRPQRLPRHIALLQP